jgi:hypothetical protein
MLEACKALNLNAQIEVGCRDVDDAVLSASRAQCSPAVYVLFIQEKHYPRSWWIRGRLRVELKGLDGKPVNPEVPNSECGGRHVDHSVMQEPVLVGREEHVSTQHGCS